MMRRLVLRFLLFAAVAVAAGFLFAGLFAA